MVVPLLTRWMLVFEEPASDTLWLAKGTPRAWLEDGQTIAVSRAPTPGDASASVCTRISGRKSRGHAWSCRQRRRARRSNFGCGFPRAIGFAR